MDNENLPQKDPHNVDENTCSLVGISFRTAGKIYDFSAGSFELPVGTQVIVETDRGRSMGRVVHAPRDVPTADVPKDIKSVVGLATAHDLELAQMNAAKEEDAYRYCQKRIQERKMEMKLVRAEYLYDGSKIIFFFTADGRVDFRELVRDLAHHFRTRIEMRQIGVRDEAKQVGGLGVCGRELCCSTFLRGFAPISVKMAKEQGLALNPTKISGQCGRLLCCLDYEFKAYCSMRKGLPKIGKKTEYNGETVDVVAINVIGQKLTIRRGDGSREEITVKQWRGEDTASCGGCGQHAAAEKTNEARPDKKPESTPRNDRKTVSKEQKASREPSKDRDQRKRSRRRPRKSGETAAGDAAKAPQAQDTTKQATKTKPATEDKNGSERPPRRRSRPRRRPRKNPSQGPKDES